MAVFLPAAFRRPRPGWRRLIQERAWVRHPVSITRQRLSLVLLFILSSGFALYLYNTRDEAIRRRVIQYLAEATAGEVKVAQAQFHMFGGITLYNVQVSVPFDEKLDRTAVDPYARQIFSASSLTLIHSPWRLLFGSLRVEHIIAAGPKITLVHNVDSGMRNWQLLAAARKPTAKGMGPSYRPSITLRAAQAVAASVHADGRREVRTEELDADIRPHPQIETAYCIEVRRFSDPPERTTVIFDPGAKLVTNTPFVDAQTVRLQLPKVAQQFFDQIALEGEVKLGRLVYAERKTEYMDTDLELRRVRCRVPLSMLRSGQPQPGRTPTTAPSTPEDSFVTLTDAMGRITLRAGQLELDVSGLFNGARCAAQGMLSGVERPLAEMGIGVHLTGSRVPAPEGPARAQILADPAVPKGLKSFFQDYEPQGHFDVDVRVDRPVGPEGNIVLHGTLKPLAVQGTCRWFPYELTHLEGQIRIEGPEIYVEKLVGRHGRSAVQVDAKIDRRTVWSEVEVDITATQTPLDQDLFVVLSQRDQTLWKHFNPRGAATLNVHLGRHGTNASDHGPPWQSTVTADLSDAELLFSEYPYPLENVHGRLILENERMRFIGLTGERGSASVRVDGEAVFEPDGSPRVELRLDARSVALDTELANALQPEGRGAIEQFQPHGRIDLAGTISLREPAQGIVYDLKAKVEGAAICYQQFPYRISDVEGELLLRPEGISIMHVEGRHGDARISARGEVTRFSDGYVADLAFDCTELALTPDLYEALPPGLKQVWNLLKPEGMVHIETALHHVSRAAESVQRHRTKIDTQDLRLCFSGFPLPLEHVEAQAVVNDRKVEIKRLRGRCGPATVDLAGEMDLTTGGNQGTLAVSTSGMSFDGEFRSALPAGLRRALEACKPVGRFDVRLDPLQFSVDADGRMRWTFDGALLLNDASAQFGIEIKNAAGEIRGHGVVGPGSAVALATNLSLDRATLAGWELEHITARLNKELDVERFDIRDVAASLYGGQATGSAQIRLGGPASEYRVAVVARDMQLARYLAAASRGQTVSAPTLAQARAATGSMDGNLILHGAGGAQPFREGSGELRLRRAQVWRMPIIFLIFQVLNLTPDENVFHDGWLKFYLNQDTLTLQTIDLQGRALSFIGGGSMDLASKELDILLLARSPVRLRIPLLTDVLEGFSREVMEVKVSGTLDKPTIRPQPLRSLGILLKALFPPRPPQTALPVRTDATP